MATNSMNILLTILEITIPIIIFHISDTMSLYWRRKPLRALIWLLFKETVIQCHFLHLHLKYGDFLKHYSNSSTCKFETGSWTYIGIIITVSIDSDLHSTSRLSRWLRKRFFTNH